MGPKKREVELVVLSKFIGYQRTESYNYFFGKNFEKKDKIYPILNWVLRNLKYDQGREFVNEVADELHSMTGTQQRQTSAYHPQSNGLVERQNHTIKNG